MSKTQDWLSAVMATETDECVLWPFSVMSSGYGDFRRAGGHFLAHRYICEQAHGAPPSSDHEAAHHPRCTSRRCCNKRHLRWATALENTWDKDEAGTMLRGEHAPNALLTEAAVAEIRRAPRTRGIGAALARKFDVHPNTIYAVRDGRSW